MNFYREIKTLLRESADDLRRSAEEKLSSLAQRGVTWDELLETMDKEDLAALAANFCGEEDIGEVFEQTAEDDGLCVDYETKKWFSEVFAEELPDCLPAAGVIDSRDFGNAVDTCFKKQWKFVDWDKFKDPDADSELDIEDFEDEYGA